MECWDPDWRRRFSWFLGACAWSWRVWSFILFCMAHYSVELCLFWLLVAWFGLVSFFVCNFRGLGFSASVGSFSSL